MVLSKFLDPKNNYAFKRIFGTEKNKDILIHFLNDVLNLTGEAKIQGVEFLNSILNPDISSKKESIVDVLCRSKNGVQVIVEMQVARTTGFEKRAQYYAAGAYFSQADVGGKYQDLKEVIFIAITDFVLFPKEPEHVSTHHILNIKTYRHYLKDFKFVFIELPKFSKTKEDQLENIFEKWCYFFKYASETSEEDLRKIVGSDEVIGRAYNELVGYNWTKEERAIYYDDKKREDDNFSCIMQSRIEGKIEGKIEVAENLLKAGASINLIAESTGLPIDEIEKLRFTYDQDKKREDDNLSCIMQSRIEGKKEREIEIAKTMLADGMNAATIVKLTGLSTDEIEKLRFTYDQDKKREDYLS